MAELSEWLQLMLAEIARKGEESKRAREEENRRQAEEHDLKLQLLKPAQPAARK